MTKRRDLERELVQAGWVRLKGGRSHDKFRKGSRTVMVPRHSVIADQMANVIRREAGLR